MLTIPEPRDSSRAAVTVKRTRIGRSIMGRPIEAVALEAAPETVLIIAGLHGDEPKSVYVAHRLIDHLSSHTPKRSVVVVPIANPDGYARRSRRNAAAVDLNRNFPTADWTSTPKWRRYYSGPRPASEPETRALVALIESRRPAIIITIHSINRHRQCNNYDGPARHLARAMSRRNKYPIRASIGYPTPGSLGTWTGVERGICTMTLELPSHHSPQRCWTDNRGALSYILGP